MKAFILRPFGKKNGIDFDNVEESLIRPALQNAGARDVATADRVDGGLFVELLAAEIVVADISGTNPVTLYELGMRLALRAERTLLICAGTADETCFVYDPAYPERSLSKLTKALRDIVLPKDQEHLAAVPPSFSQEVQQASADHQAAKLILLGLEVQGAPWETPALALIGPALLAVPPGSVWERVVLFTGHRVDSRNRKTPRFPPAKEQVARDAIRRALEEQQQKSSKGSMLGVAGGANGGDLLFLEVGEELGIATEMLLTLPEEQFVKESVESDDKNWTERFYRQVQKHVHPPVLARSAELPAWLEFKTGYDIWQRNNLWLLSAALSHMARFLTVIALWDGKIGDAPGGTEHMVGMARERGAQIVHLDTRRLFGLREQGSGPFSASALS